MHVYSNNSITRVAGDPQVVKTIRRETIILNVSSVIMELYYNKDDLGYSIGLPVNLTINKAIHPKDAEKKVLKGMYCSLYPLDIDRDAEELFESFSSDTEIWRYMNYGPFVDANQYREFLTIATSKPNEYFYTIQNSNGRAVGVCSYLRIDCDNKSIEVGHLTFSKLMKKSVISSEALILMARHAFNVLGYRRYEWKCNVLNEPSINAAERLGFTFEGIHRQAVISKGRNRDTCWFSIIDSEWILLEKIYMDWLYSIDSQAIQSYSLSSKTKNKQSFPEFSIKMEEKK